MSTSVSRSTVVVQQPWADSSSRFLPRVRRLLGRAHTWIHEHPRVRAPYRMLVALAGATIVVVGLILVPLPGPGWLIVFVGIAVLGTEFPAAHRVTQSIRRHAHRLRLWWRSRHPTPTTPEA